MKQIPEKPTITDRFPPVPMRELLERIRAFPAERSEARRATVRRLVDAHAITGLRWGQGWRYRRGRILEDGETAIKVRDLIWREGVPPRMGRANAAGFGALYLSDRRDTALSELRVVDGQVVLAEFVIRPDLEMLVAPVGEMIQIQRTGRFPRRRDVPTPQRPNQRLRTRVRQGDVDH